MDPSLFKWDLGGGSVLLRVGKGKEGGHIDEIRSINNGCSTERDF